MYEDLDKLNSMPLSIEYIGSKRLLLKFIVGAVRNVVGDGPADIADIFSGTGIVSAAFKANGFEVSANDHLATCFNLTAAILLNHTEPSFSGLDRVITTQAESPYLAVIKYLNEMPAQTGGFIHTNYSPFSKEHLGYERLYFSEVNAARIDTIRSMIHEWRYLLTPEESALLLADLIQSASSVSNVAGTYGCYLKKWKRRALETLQLKPSTFILGGFDNHYVTSLDAQEALSRKSTSIVYADPPYTKRQYAAYYHVLETIARNDNPELKGTTGLRNWEAHASDFCYKRKAESALEGLVKTANCEHFFLSYNNDGQISHSRIFELLSAYGEVSVTELDLKRYRSSNRPHKGPTVVERLYHIHKNR
jgi:adenine-specific DNA-methyltransferase